MLYFIIFKCHLLDENQMTKNKIAGLLLISSSLVFLTLLSCNNHPGDIPFPEKELGYSQPVTVPLQFTAEKKLTWDTAKQGGVKPVIKKLDLDRLPSRSYDSTGFQLFAKPPEEVHFDFNSLPDAAFNLDNLPSKSLHFKTSMLAPPAMVKTLPPSVQKGNPLSIFDFGPRHGLPAKFVTALLKDKSGLMWIASAEGLFRYDGEHVQTFIQGSLGAPIVGMAEDNKGRIWFIQVGKTGMIDPQMGTISYTALISIGVNSLSKIIKDENGRIWISKTTAKEVIIIDPASQTYKSLASSNGLSDVAGANDITEDDNGNIWISTAFGGADIVNLKTNKIKYLKNVNGLAKDSLRAITKDKAGQIWIGIAGGGVDAIDVQRNTIRHYNELQGLKQAFIADISSDNKGRIWIGKNQGVDILDPENGRIRLIDNSRGLSENFVTSCTMDNNHRMWVATIVGLHIIDQNAETVNPLGTTSIISLMEDAVGNLWVATQRGIELIDAQKKRIRRLDKSDGLGNDFVQSFAKFGQQIWVTTNGGLDIIDPLHKTIEHTGKNEGLVNDTIYVVFKDKAGSTWLTGPSNGIDLIDSAKKTILHTDVAGGLSDNNIGDIKQDHDGLVWLASNSNGINVV
ncbi:MAG: hypothetical protein JWM28_2840, partial [Chitinophagaceae bacterium]|nr:hypothetical protein [Chitinophagaceae bacterium]